VLFKPEYATKWATYDPKRANALLDDMGLTKRNDLGFRLLPDGRQAAIIVESAGQSTEAADIIELIRDTWREVGIKLYYKPSQLTVFRNRVFSGQAMMAIYNGIDNGLVTADMPPIEFAPVTQQQLQWPKWGQYYEDKGRAGIAPDMPMGQELMRLYNSWFNAGTKAERRAVWGKILSITADKVPTIGIVAGVPQPVVVSNRLRNVPINGIYAWDPGAQFGIYHPDHFWLADDAQAALPAPGR
jgi:peptide/nickel transport system substrate-binding protein